jgi:hypothetical protein
MSLSSRLQNYLSHSTQLGQPNNQPSLAQSPFFQSRSWEKFSPSPFFRITWIPMLSLPWGGRSKWMPYSEGSFGAEALIPTSAQWYTPQNLRSCDLEAVSRPTLKHYTGVGPCAMPDSMLSTQSAMAFQGLEGESQRTWGLCGGQKTEGRTTW